jgi:hypothetical protein
VTANASPLNFQNAQLQQAVTPTEIRDLPLLISGNIRSAARFVVLTPGVTTGGGNQGYDARINGGMQSGDEAEIDGVTFSSGIWLLGTYTWPKLLTDTDNVQTTAIAGSSTGGVISPFERERNKALSIDDVPQQLNLSFIDQLPIGRGERFLENAGGAVNAILGGLQFATIFRAASGTPMYFRSSNCNVPSQFDAACIPAIWN